MENDSLFSRLRNWFGPLESDGEQPDGTPHHHSADSPHQAATRLMMSAMTNFIVSHDLPFDAETVSFAFDLVSETDPLLPRQVHQRLTQRLPITREWIGEVRGDPLGEETRALDDLRKRLEGSIADFGKTTKDARSATTSYQSALRSHVGELDEVSSAGAMIHELAAVARAMIDRTQEIEQQMVRSERETRNLQRRLDEARRNAEIDHLTGLPNRRAFEAMLQEEYEQARRQHDDLCVAFCDIDKFKAINDSHGHDAGDRVLRLVARTLADISDDRCHVARHGGEEFVVLFRGADIDAAFAKLDATRDGLANRRLVNRATDTPFGKISFSAGIADVFAFANPRAALKAADQALYAAKEQGRDRIVLARQTGEAAGSAKAA